MAGTRARTRTTARVALGVALLVGLVAAPRPASADDSDFVIQDEAERGTATPFIVHVSGGATDGRVDVTWEVVPESAPDATPLLTGTAVSAPVYEVPPIGTNDVLTDGTRYIYRGSFEADVEGRGRVSGTASTSFTWDGTVSVTAIRLDSRDTYRDETLKDVGVFYPEYDHRGFRGWRDDVEVKVLKDSESEPVRIEALTIRNTAGVVVRRITDPRRSNSWNGRRANGDVVPKGLYAVEATISDPLGNTTTLDSEVVLSHERIQRAYWQKTITPKKYLTDRFVGRCASLKFPARAGWRGSIGLRSRDSGPRCRDLRSQTASTVYGILLPRTPLGDADLYDHVRVSTYGGGTPGTGYSYLVHWYWSTGEDWIERSQFDQRLGWHGGKRVGSNVVHGDPDKERPAVYWSVGLAEGANYDVKRFRISVQYWDVR